MVNMSNVKYLMEQGKNYVFLRWQHQKDVKHYHFKLSYFKDCSVPVSTYYDRVIKVNEIRIDLKRLANSKVYFWRVRAAKISGVFCDWGPIQSFEISS